MDFFKMFVIGKSVLKGYLFSKYSWKSPDFLSDMQNRALRKTVFNAYSRTGFYNRKYKELKIGPQDILTVKDLHKLPIISKQELKENFAESVPRTIDKRKALLLGTSGSTGRPIQIYKDYIWLSHCFGFGFLMLKLHKMGLPKAAFIFDVDSASSIESNAHGFLKLFAKRALVLSVEHDVVHLMEQLEKSDINCLATYTGIMRELAFLKKNGMGKKLKLKKVGVTGEILDNYTRDYIEEAFGCPCFSCYITIISDLVAVEIVDKDGNLLPPGKDGNIVITCLDGGQSTPIIRYSGCSDVGQLLDIKCSCGLNTPVMGPVKGRIMDSIYLPDGRIYHAFAMTIPMEKIQRKHGRDRIRQYQIVQNELDEIEISIVRNKEKAPRDDPLTDLMDVLKQAYQVKFGDDIHVVVKEVKEIPRSTNNGMPTPLVLSKVGADRQDKRWAGRDS
jgi:phenylacetate-CoA ligase